MTIWGLLTTGGGTLAIVLCLIQISPIKINPWSWLARKFGRAINSELIQKVDKLEKDVEHINIEIGRNQAICCRTRILRFGDEVLHGVKHSKDHFDQTLLDIGAYDQYCASHKDFQNNVTTMTADLIKSVYRERLDKGDFL